MTPRKLNRAVIKEEFVALTGDYYKALLLNQFIYWSERVRDADKLIQEEAERMKLNGEKLNMNKQHGWIYKKAEELSEELMLGASAQTIRRHLKHLIDNKWIEERRNPNYNWDKTLQYRVDFVKIMIDLRKLGYHLEGYEVLETVLQTNLQIGASRDHYGDSDFHNESSNLHNGFPNLQIGASEAQIGDSSKNSDVSNIQFDFPDFQNSISNVHDGGAIPEITSENTSKSLIDCMGATAEAASAHEAKFIEEDKVNTAIYDELKTHIPINCYIAKGKTMSDYEINQIYTMIIKQFPNFREPEIVRLACGIYFDRASKLDLVNGTIEMKMEIANPVGFFRTCFVDAVSQYRASLRA